MLTCWKQSMFYHKFHDAQKFIFSTSLAQSTFQSDIHSCFFLIRPSKVVFKFLVLFLSRDSCKILIKSTVFLESYSFNSSFPISYSLKNLSDCIFIRQRLLYLRSFGVNKSEEISFFLLERSTLKKNNDVST